MSIGAEEPSVSPMWAAYRKELLDLVGDDDPAEVQASTPAAVRERVAAASAGGVLRTPPADGEWSVLGLVGHLLDGEIYASARYRWILSEDRPGLEGYDQDRVANASRHADADPDVLLAAWEGLRRANLALWTQASPEARSREGVHPNVAQAPTRSYSVRSRATIGSTSRRWIEPWRPCALPDPIGEPSEGARGAPAMALPRGGAARSVRCSVGQHPRLRRTVS